MGGLDNPLLEVLMLAAVRAVTVDEFVTNHAVPANRYFPADDTDTDVTVFGELDEIGIAPLENIVDVKCSPAAPEGIVELVCPAAA